MTTTNMFLNFGGKWDSPAERTTSKHEHVQNVKSPLPNPPVSILHKYPYCPLSFFVTDAKSKYAWHSISDR